jgi:hypothetical protein
MPSQNVRQLPQAPPVYSHPGIMPSVVENDGFNRLLDVGQVRNESVPLPGSGRRSSADRCVISCLIRFSPARCSGIASSSRQR